MAKDSGVVMDCDIDIARKTAASKIFDAAMELFYRRGIRGVGVDEIVCEAGVTKPSLYRAFKSKDDLVAACLLESAREGRDAVHAAIAAAGRDPRDRLRAVAGHFSDMIQRPEFRGCLASNVAVELPEPNHPGRLVLQGCKTHLRGLIAGLAREVGVAQPDLLADGMMLVIEGAISTHHILGSQGPAQALTATCDALIDQYLERARIEARAPSRRAVEVAAC
jgi:AcrR family transcriptional regulator